MSHGPWPQKRTEVYRCRYLQNISAHKDLIPKLVLQLQLHEALPDICKILAWNEAQVNPSQNAVMGICISVPFLFSGKGYVFCDFIELKEELLVIQIALHVFQQKRLKIRKKVNVRTQGL